MKKFSPNAIQALKEALTHIYWRKKDLRSFVYHTLDNKAIVTTIDWDNNYKHESVSHIVDRMASRLDIYNDDLLRLFDAVMHMNDFSHLKQWDDSDSKIKKAADSVNALRTHAEGYFTLKEERERAEQRKTAYTAMVSEKLNSQQKIAELRNDFFSLSVESNPQKRGYMFEKFLNELFLAFDLDPKKSFKIVGEQVDGAFTFDNQDYLLEAKWQKEPIQAGDLFDFGGKIDGKFKAALGLFISINGFSPDSTKVSSPIIKSMILMDGSDLMAILENRTSLKDMLFRKRRHATEKGEIYFPFQMF
ncbi:restriction endonuclease [Methylomonas sp. MS20]|uniref:restriction endonuclease n=1 Tax=unclassified Methylomonas TaxID=2608980 RepID=UPI0028A388B5|nr:restriction endonuclease [Methylomonas sp. MV1]MDT4329001.1 restriction endonuclease [Methylomonas sp. MV1]